MNAPVHGGPDARGAARWDFSTCANAAGPCPLALAAVRAADCMRYPDPSYHALRRRLAALHGVEPERVLLAASASEFIQRIVAVGAHLAPGPVALPQPGYGDYARAARAFGRAIVPEHDGCATLRFCADPGSPHGCGSDPPDNAAACPTVLDAVYAPLRLAGASRWDRAARDAVFVLHSPNKALGLCGVRGAYAVAPARAAYDVARWVDALRAAEPSWVLSAHGAAMLAAWCEPAVQGWVRDSLPRLARWKDALAAALRRRGAQVHDSETNFFCLRLRRAPAPQALRAHAVAVRELSSFGLPGAWRLSVQPPRAQRALLAALAEAGC